MFNPTKTVIRDFTRELTPMYEETYGILEPSYPGVISFVARLALENFDQRRLQLRPGLAVHLCVESGIREPGMLAQQRVELRLDRSDRDEIAAGAFIDAVEMRAAVKKILITALGPAAHCRHVEKHRHQ